MWQNCMYFNAIKPAVRAVRTAIYDVWAAAVVYLFHQAAA